MLDVITAFLVSFAFDLGRYVVVAIPAFLIFWIHFGERLRGRWLRPLPPAKADLRREIAQSLRTAVIFAVVGTVLFVGAKAGIFRVYEGIGRYGLPYFFASPLVLIVLQDTYFYFTHRLMHHRLLFRAFHRAHHVSRHTSPFTAYAFSPLEALVQAAFVPLAALVLPFHQIALSVFLGFMIVRNVLGHLAIELYSPAFSRSRFLVIHTTTTHHALHHLRPGTNFGLYFTFWDRLLGTTDPAYEARFEEAASGKCAR